MKSKLFLLFALSALERFGFNGLRSMLILFMVNHLLVRQGDAFNIYASMMMLTYIIPLLSGWVADRFLNKKLTLLIGSLLNIAGGITLNFLGANAFLLGLSFIVLGSGFMRPSLLSLLNLKIQGLEVDRDSIFTTLHITNNIGTLLGTILCAMSGETFGWQFGLFMVLLSHLAALVMSLKFFYEKYFVSQELLKPLLIIIFGFAVSFYLLTYGGQISTILTLAYVIFLLVIFTRSCFSTYETKIQTREILLIILFVTVFFTFYEQSGHTLVLFTQRNVDLTLFHLRIPVTAFQALDPILTVLMGASFALFWNKISKRGILISPYAKLASGILFLSIGFGVLALSYFINEKGLVSPWFIFLAITCFVAGELCMVPIGMSMILKRAPEKYSGVISGIWFSAHGVSQLTSAQIAKNIVLPMEASTDPLVSLPNYCSAFHYLFIIGMTFSVSAMLFAIKKEKGLIMDA